jgi:biopolymer transport protein ExbD
MPTAQNKIFVYEGLAVENEHASLYTSDHLNELRLRIIRKREMVRKMTGKPSDMLVLIKPDKDCSYQTLVDLLDEMTINDITRYAIENRDVYDEKLVLKPGI